MLNVTLDCADIPQGLSVLSEQVNDPLNSRVKAVTGCTYLVNMDCVHLITNLVLYIIFVIHKNSLTLASIFINVIP